MIGESKEPQQENISINGKNLIEARKLLNLSKDASFEDVKFNLKENYCKLLLMQDRNEEEQKKFEEIRKTSKLLGISESELRSGL